MRFVKQLRRDLTPPTVALATMLMILTNAAFAAQDSLYTFTSPDTTTFTQEQADRWDTVLTYDFYSDLHFISLTSARDWTNYDGTIRVPLPVSGHADFDVEMVDIMLDSVHTWYGVNTTTTYDFGYLATAEDDSGYFGSFQLDEESFNILDLTGGVYVLAEVDTIAFKRSCAAPVGSGSVPQIDEEEPVTTISTRAGGPCDIRIVFTYSQRAIDYYYDLKYRVIAQTFFANKALLNTEFGQDELQHVISGFLKLTGFSQDKSDPVGDFEALQTNSTLQSIVSQRQADVAVVCVKRPYDCGLLNRIFGGCIWGGVFDIGEDSLDESIVVMTGSLPYFGIAHEVGHLIGGRHQNDPLGTYEHGFAIDQEVGWDYHTVMHSTRKTHILHYSDPDIDYNGDPTGTSEDEDVARLLEEEGCTYSELNDFTANVLGARIEGFNWVEPDSSETFTATGLSGTLPYTYKWETSTDGINFDLESETSSEIVLIFDYDEGTHVFLKLTITDDDDDTAVDIMTIKVDDDPPEEIAPPIKPNGQIDVIRPNPTTGQFVVEYSVLERGSVSLVVQSLSGIRIKSVDSFKEPGTYTTNIVLPKLPESILIIQLSVNDKLSDSKKLALSEN